MRRGKLIQYAEVILLTLRLVSHTHSVSAHCDLLPFYDVLNVLNFTRLLAFLIFFLERFREF